MRMFERWRASRWMVAATVAGCVVVAGGGVALAASGGGYSPSQQDCPVNADANNAGTQGAPQNPVPGCHNFKLNVEDGNGKRFAEVGLDQLPQGYSSTPGLLGVGQPGSPNFPHSGCVAVNPSGTGGGPGTGCGNGAGGAFDTENTGRNALTTPSGTPDLAGMASDVAANGLQVYLGADDNLDAGEHDGVDGLNGTGSSANGPSDGGAVRAHVTPSAAGQTPGATDPLPAVGAGEGFCADGICQDVTTYQQTLYQGNPDTTDSRDVYNYDGKQWDPYNCSSGSNKDEQACQGSGFGSMNDYRNHEAHSVNAEPGVQIYEDPDPQGSPIDPLHEAGLTGKTTPLYPLPGAYVGTCGVVAGGGAVAQAPASPVTNKAGQVVVSPTGC